VPGGRGGINTLAFADRANLSRSGLQDSSSCHGSDQDRFPGARRRKQQVSYQLEPLKKALQMPRGLSEEVKVAGSIARSKQEFLD
jgi:hypothetical protein